MSVNALITLTMACSLALPLYGMLIRCSASQARWTGIGGLFVLVFGLTLLRSHQLCLFSDVPFHLSLIRATAAGGSFPGDPFFYNVATPLHYSIWHVAGGYLLKILGNLEITWWVLGLGYVALAGGATLALANVFFNDARTAWVAALCSSCWVGFGDMIPSFSLSAFFLFMWAMATVVKEDVLTWRRVLLAAVLIGLSISVRLYEGLVGYLFIVAWILCGFRKGNQTTGRFATWVMIGGPLLIASPWLLNAVCQLHGGEQGSGVAGCIQDGGSYLGTRIVWLRESCLWKYSGPAPVRAACGVLWGLGLVVLMRSRYVPERIRRFVQWSGVFWGILLILPLDTLIRATLDPLRAARLLDVVGRFVNATAPLVVVVAPLHWLRCAAEASGAGKAKFVIHSLLYGCLLVLAFSPAAYARVRISYGTELHPRFAYVFAGKQEIMNRLYRKTVLSDGWTSYMTQYVIGHYCVTVPAGHSSTLVNIPERAEKVQRLFAGAMTPPEAGSFLSRQGVDYILVNRRLAERRPIPHFDLYPTEYAGWADDWSNRYPFLRLVYQDTDVELLCVDQTGTSSAWSR